MKWPVPFSLRAAAIVALVNVLAPVSLHAIAWDAPAFSLPPADLAAAAAQLNASGSDGVVIMHEEDSFTYDAAGASVHSYRIIYKITSREGISRWSTVSCSWQPWRQDTPTIRARVIGTDGRVSPLDPKTIADRTAPTKEPDVYSDSRVLDAPLPNMETGVVVEYEILRSDRAPLLGGGSIERVWFGHSDPVLSRRLLVDWPAGLELRYAARGTPALAPARQEANGRVSLRFDAANLPALKAAERLLPPDATLAGCVDFSTGASWKDLARAYVAVTEPMIDVAALTDYMKGVANAAGANPPDRVAAILYRLQKDVRYTGIDFGENAIIPHAPSDTLKRGYGDCKDQSVLLVTALRAEGIDARLALLMAGDGLDVSPQLPGLGLFNHAIVYLPGRQIWVDPTADFTPMGELPLMDQGRRALIIAPGTEALSVTPDSFPSQNWYRETREIRLADAGPAAAVETSAMGGSIAEDYRSGYDRSSPARARDHLEKYVKAEYEAGALANFATSDPRAMETPFTMSVEASEARIGITDDSSAVVRIHAGGLLRFLPDFITNEDAKGTPFARVNDMRLWMPFVAESTWHIVPPPGYRSARLPAEERISFGPAVLTKVFTLNGDGSVNAALRFDCVKRLYTAEETVSLHQAVRKFLAGAVSTVSFEQVGESLLAAGKYRESLSEFRALAALSPGKALHRVQISRALLAAGFGGDALKEARAAAALQPLLAMPHGNLAWTLLHDEFGRLLATGVDLAAARAEYERARQLQPSDATYARNLAILDEYNDSLVRYGPGARLDEAVGLYRAIEKDIRGTEYWANLSIDLLYLGRFQEIKETLREGASTPTLEALYVAASAALDGAAEAQKEAVRLVPSAERRRTVLASAAQFLLHIRQYPQTAELMIASARGTVNLTSSMAMADLLRTLVPVDPKSLSDSSPQGVILHLMSLLLQGNGAMAEIESLMSSGNRSALADPTEQGDAMRGLEAVMGTMKQLPLPSDTMLDLMTRFISVQTIELGAATVALMTIPAFPSTSPVVFYLSREAGSYRFVDASGNLAGLARECIALLDSGRLDDARAWMLLVRTQHTRAPAFPDESQDPVFSLLPNTGQENAQEIRLAAGYLLLRSFSPTEAKLGVSIVLPEWRATNAVSRRLTLEAALARALVATGRKADLAEIAPRYMEDDPNSIAALADQSIAMEQAGRLADAEALIRSRLAAKPGDLGLMRLLVDRLAAFGKYADAVSVAGSILDSGDGNEGDYNNFSWFSLFAGAIDPAVMEKRQIVPRLIQGNSSELHTLACVLADSGRFLEAQEVFGKYLDKRGSGLPEPAAWLPHGILAQRFGLDDSARAAFQKVGAEGMDSSSWALAQIHLKEMQAAGK